MEATIAGLLRRDNGPDTELITRYDDIPLLRKEFRTLNDETWLLDEVFKIKILYLLKNIVLFVFFFYLTSDNIYAVQDQLSRTDTDLIFLYM